MAHTTTKEELKHQCIENCIESHRVCLETVDYCLEKGGKHADAEHIRHLYDCAEICKTSADFMVRNSKKHKAVCELCADICESCVDDCEEMGEDAQMTLCADTSRRSMESCREMAR